MSHVYKQNKTVKEKQSTLDLVQQTHMTRLKSKHVRDFLCGSLLISTAKQQYPNVMQVSLNLGLIPMSIKLIPRNNNNK